MFYRKTAAERFSTIEDKKIQNSKDCYAENEYVAELFKSLNLILLLTILHQASQTIFLL